MDETRVHDALERLAADAPASSDAVWERTQQRIARRRRARVLVTGALVVALLLGAAGVVAAVRSNNDSNRVAAGLAEVPRTPEQVLAVVNGRLELRSTANGELGGHVDQVQYGLEGDDVVAVPGAPYFVYTKEPTPTRSNMPVGGPLVRVRVSDGAQTLITDAATFAPSISPDGRLLAYRVTNRYGVRYIAVSDLRTLQPIAIVDPSSRQYVTNLSDGETDSAEPLAWTLDSKRLLVRNRPGSYALLGIGEHVAPRPIALPHGVQGAAFLSDDRIAIVYRTELNGPDSLAAYGISTGARRPLGPKGGVREPFLTRPSFDPASDALLVTATADSDGPGRLITVTPTGSHVGPKIAGLISATWFAPPSIPSSAPTTTAGAASVTVPNVVGLKVAAAERALEAAGLRASPSQNPDRSVLQQDPQAASVVARGTPVTLTTCPASSDCVIPPGPSHGGRVVVPDVGGMRLVDANARLERLGLVAQPATDAGTHIAASNRTTWQDPPPGTTVTVGAGVWVWSCPNGMRCAVPPSTFLQPFHFMLGWRPVDANDVLMQSYSGRHFDTPDAFARAIVTDIEHSAEAPGAVTYTITNRESDSVHVWVQTRNLPDDSIDGADYDFVVSRAGSKWTLHDGRVRTVCVRGVASADSCR